MIKITQSQADRIETLMLWEIRHSTAPRNLSVLRHTTAQYILTGDAKYAQSKKGFKC